MPLRGDPCFTKRPRDLQPRILAHKYRVYHGCWGVIILQVVYVSESFVNCDIEISDFALKFSAKPLALIFGKYPAHKSSHRLIHIHIRSSHIHFYNATAVSQILLGVFMFIDVSSDLERQRRFINVHESALIPGTIFEQFHRLSFKNGHRIYKQ